MRDKDVRTPKVVTQFDQALAARLRVALRALDGVVIVDVTNGEVTLAGVVPSAAIAADIADIAAGVDGVVAVTLTASPWDSLSQSMPTSGRP